MQRPAPPRPDRRRILEWTKTVVWTAALFLGLRPPDHVLVFGDNRNRSLDGHVWGFLEEEALLARAWVRYWPPDRIGRL